MEPDFWIERWKNRQIGFHESETNALLRKHLPEAWKVSGKKVFVPLCGKTLSIHWFLELGLDVIGVELSEIAILELFDELNLKPKIEEISFGKKFSSKSLIVFQSDFFKLSSRELGAIDFSFDRASLVALPKDLRAQYTKHLIEITENAAQLLIVFEYDQTASTGPPFSISEQEISEHYSKKYSYNCLEKKDLEGGFRTATHATENVWLLN